MKSIITALTLFIGATVASARGIEPAAYYTYTPTKAELGKIQTKVFHLGKKGTNEAIKAWLSDPTKRIVSWNVGMTPSGDLQAICEFLGK